MYIELIYYGSRAEIAQPSERMRYLAQRNAVKLRSVLQRLTAEAENTFAVQVFFRLAEKDKAGADTNARPADKSGIVRRKLDAAG